MSFSIINGSISRQKFNIRKYNATWKFNFTFSIGYADIQRHDEEEEGAELGQLEGAVQVHGRKDVLQGLQEEVQWRGESLDSFTCSKFEAIWQSIFPSKVLRVNDNVYFHPACFRCHRCQASLAQGGFFTRWVTFCCRVCKKLEWKLARSLS